MENFILLVKTKKAEDKCCAGCFLECDETCKDIACDDEHNYQEAVIDCVEQKFNCFGTVNLNINACYEIKPTENWQACTKKNTKVGDVVRFKENHNDMLKVDFIFEYSNTFVLTLENSKYQYAPSMECYEIDINKEK